MRLEHANITVVNIEKSLSFYHELFGFNTRWEGTATGEQGPIRAVHIGDEHTYLSLFEAEKSGRSPADYSVPGVNHIGFEVQELDNYRQRLEQLGVEIHLEQDYEPGKRIYFYDPDGVEIELVEYPR
jgi:catechol 2,3-dioxygenase-like lactoylglutathione lyase family enzyme